MLARVARQPLFAGVAADRLEELAAAASERLAAAGDLLVERGQPASGLFVLEEGRAVVERPGLADSRLGPGDVFGEIALIGLRPERSARVRAVTECRCLGFPRADLERMLANEPEVANRLRTLAEKRLAG